MKIHVKVPATTANLGPGFDALGLALNLWNEAEFACTSDSSISVRVKGEGEKCLPKNADNAIAQAALMIYDLAGKSCEGLHIDCINRVPLGSGMGSSSAALLTGMLGANGLLGNPFTDEEILKLAIETEGHPDNVAPAMLGGLVASIVHKERVVSMRLPTKANHGPSTQQLFCLISTSLPVRHARFCLKKWIAPMRSIILVVLFSSRRHCERGIWSCSVSQ